MSPEAEEAVLDGAFHCGDYYIQACAACPFLVSVPGTSSVTTLADKYPVAYRTIVAVFRGGFCQWSYPVRDLEEVFGYLVEQGSFNGVFEEWEKDRVSFESACRKIEKTDFARLDDRALVGLFEEFYRKNLDVWALALLADAVNLQAEPVLMRNLAAHLKRRGEEKLAPRCYAALTSLGTASFAVSERLGLLRIAQSMKEGKDVVAMLESHSRKWFWLKNSYLDAERLTSADFKKDLAEIMRSHSRPSMERRRIREKQLEVSAEKSRLLSVLGLPGDVLRLLRLVGEFGAWQDERKKYNLIADHYLMVFLKEASKRSGVDVSLAKYALPAEFSELVFGRLSSDELRARSKGTVVVYVNGSEIVRTGARVRQAEKVIAGNGNAAVYDEVRGVCASVGRVQGTAKVIRQASDLPKMKYGDVLVSPMTRPELVPAMKLAAAVVTDEGGATCHAAIISRELGLPCVVGTRIATKALNDGDVVEVNANHGVVKIIKRAVE